MTQQEQEHYQALKEFHAMVLMTPGEKKALESAISLINPADLERVHVERLVHFARRVTECAEAVDPVIADPQSGRVFPQIQYHLNALKALVEQL